MGIIVYGSLQSACTQRVLLVLNELGIQFDLKEISMQKGEHKDPHYIINFHPFGRLPALQDDATKLFESRAICRYLVAKYGKESYLDTNGRDKPDTFGNFEQALSIEYSYFDPCMKSLAFENMFKGYMGLGEADLQEVDRSISLLKDVLDYYEKNLAANPYLGGDHFTLIDIYHLPWVRFFFVLPYQDEISSRPNFKAWWERVSKRKSWMTVSEKI